MIVALDPGINKSGVALFSDAGTLLAAATVKCDSVGDNAQRCAAMASAIHEWLCLAVRAVAAYGGLQEEISKLVFEWPRIYPHERGKRPNDLPPLAGIGMALQGRLQCAIMSYFPSEWAGQIPKAKTKKAADESPRALRIKEHLWDGEKRHWPYGEHDAIDAIGIGLHHLGRLRPKRVFPGARN